MNSRKRAIAPSGTNQSKKQVIRFISHYAGQRAVSAEKIAADVFNRLPGEYQDISEADWHAAATHVAPLIDRLSEKD